MTWLVPRSNPSWGLRWERRRRYQDGGDRPNGSKARVADWPRLVLAFPSATKWRKRWRSIRRSSATHPSDQPGERMSAAVADMTTVFGDVRFRGKSGHSEVRWQCPLMTRSGHCAMALAPLNVDDDAWRSPWYSKLRLCDSERQGGPARNFLPRKLRSRFRRRSTQGCAYS